MGAYLGARLAAKRQKRKRDKPSHPNASGSSPAHVDEAGKGGKTNTRVSTIEKRGVNN